ncbi:MAG: hypothetical protein IPL49_09710 [Saprospirales bacterium]|nr:hypothetical protein [Saprospirales bacterium]
MEREAEEDFSLLLSTGPVFFSTAQLLEMYGRVLEREVLFHRLRRAIVWAGALSPSWILVGFIFGLMGWIPLASVAFVLFPVSLLFFLGGAFLLQSWLGTRGSLEHMRLLLEMELSRRKEGTEKNRG